MKSYDYTAITFDADVYCAWPRDCAPEGAYTGEYENGHAVLTEEAHPIFADSEWDTYPVCGSCHEVHDYVSLTTDGRIALWDRATAHETERVKNFRLGEDKRGLLEKFAFPGGYPVEYFTKDGSLLCADCANEVRLENITDKVYYDGTLDPSDAIVDAGVNEGNSEPEEDGGDGQTFCADCGVQIDGEDY